MKKKLTGWEAFEMANKYYVIYTGTLWIVGSLALLIYYLLAEPSPSPTLLTILFIFILAGVLVLYVGMKSKVSSVKES